MAFEDIIVRGTGRRRTSVLLLTPPHGRGLWSDVRWAAEPDPFPLEVLFNDLGSALPRQSGLVQRQLAHVHVVLA